MKKTLPFFITFLLSFLIFSPRYEIKANAETTYYRIIDNDTAFYSQPDINSALFFLPYSYYVNKIGEYGDFYRVEITGENIFTLDGFVLKEKLFYDALPVETPYPEITVTTAYTGALYENADLKTPLQYIFKDREMNFYGEFTTDNGEKLYFVDYNGKLGYIKEEIVYSFYIPLHKNPLTFIVPEEPDTPADAIKEDDAYIYKVAIIGCLVIAGLIGLIATLTKRKREKPVVYPEEEV